MQKAIPSAVEIFLFQLRKGIVEFFPGKIMEVQDIFVRRRNRMKIKIDGKTVEFEPETQAEAMELELLVKTMGSGLKDGIHLAADGIYSRRIDSSAKFRIEGMEGQDMKNGPLMPFEGDVYCYTCGRKKHLKAGEPIPMCCGKYMDILN